MVRVIVLSLAVLVSAQALPAFAQTVSITAKLSDGSFVDAVCHVKNGQINGTGVLYGNNNGYIYKYPFPITSGSTASGKLVLNGYFAAAPGSIVQMSLTVPSGPVTFVYVVNGKSFTLTGTGTVLVQ